jgi:hypothetical protein
MSSTKGKKRKKTMASQADRYALYLKSVQAPNHEVHFFKRAFKKEFGRPALKLREDFCGTFAICCEWVKGSKDRVALGVDIDPEPLAWGRKHNLSKLKPASQQRVTIHQEDVRKVTGPKAEVLAAQNFSFWYFKTRPEVVRYFKAARANMASKGLMFLDMMGGPETITENHEDITEYDDFDYIWEQERFDPISHDCRYHIHYHFKDGSKLKRAFTYEWRFWTIPEVREMLAEAGFRRSDVYWEATDKKTGEGNDIYTIRQSAPGDEAWIAYIVAVK